MKNLFMYTLPVVALCTLAACSDKDDITNVVPKTVDPNEGKELIEFSGEGNAITRATLTRAGFSSEAETEILVKMVAVDNRTGEGFPLTSRNTVTWATASTTKTSDDHTTSDLLGVGFAHSDVSYKEKSGNTDYTRYWDDAFGRHTNLSVYAVAVPGKSGKISTNTSNGAILATDGGDVSSINTNWKLNSSNTNTVEWTISAEQEEATMADEDLTFSNNIQNGETTNKGRYTWDYANDKQIMGLGYLRWIVNPSDANGTTGKFDKGHLVFRHALTKITINLTEGENAGFNNSSTADFNWTKNNETVTQNITLKGFKLHGTLNVSAGTWSSTDAAKDITTMYETTGEKTAKTVRTVHAYCLPDRALNVATNVITFEIDGNEYNVTGNQILDAIHDYYTTGEGKNETKAPNYRSSTFTTTKLGDNYIINLTIGKKKIDNITAHVVDWEQVNSDEIKPSNVHTSFTFYEPSSHNNSVTDALKFDIYRAKQTVDNVIEQTTLTSAPNYVWWTGYNDGDSRDVNNSKLANKTYSSGHWTTTWFWPDNKTYYHFRAVGNYDATAIGEKPDVAENNPSTNFITTTEGKDYFKITSGTNYKDYVWGAPFEATGSSLTYSTSTGFDNQSGSTHQISKGISATDSPIKMLLFHMTSQIFVEIETAADGTADKVELYKSDGEVKTQVNLLRFAKDGTVRMGDGLVAAETTITDSEAMSYNGDENLNTAGVDKVKFKYGVVPQALSRGDTAGDKVGLQIITPDGNEYFIQDLSIQKATSVTTYNLTNPYGDAVDGKYTIPRWYPNYQYTYKITIKKTGIKDITAAVVDWEIVNGTNIDVNLEN